MNNELQDLDEKAYIRHKLYAGGKSNFRRYAELVIGESSLWGLLKYELITTFLGPLPGALGLFLRKIFYPKLFKRVGKGTVFGRNVVVRNAHMVCLGERVMIDDNCLIDGRGAGEEGVLIGDQVMINRNVTIQAKIGPISIGANSDIGADSNIISQGGIYIGEMAAFGGGCHIGGGLFRLDATSGEEPSRDTAGHGSWVGGQHRFTKGPIRIGPRCAFAGYITVTDGVTIGSGCVIAPGAVIQEDVPADSVVMVHQKLVVMPWNQLQQTETEAVKKPQVIVTQDGVTLEKVLEGIYRAIDELNEQLPAEKRLEKSPDTALVEPQGPLDSLGLVNLIVTTERIIGEELGKTVDLTATAPWKSMEGETPFRTPQGLAKYISGLLESAGDA